MVKCDLINAFEYNFVINKLRNFFINKSFVEVPTQSRLSILAACEDPKTIASFHFANQHYPLPQTGQMWLERELLSSPNCPGFYCISTSYRNEKNPISGRHDLIFPMFEFELPGNMKTLETLESELLEYLGFKDFKYTMYKDVAKKYNTVELTAEHETMMNKDLGSVVFLESFPEYTSPFWNMKRNHLDKELANKIDVIIHGMETIGSAERSCDRNEMRNSFHTISNGEYAGMLYSLFSKERVEEELESFLDFNFFDRAGGGIGVTRMIRAMKLEGLLNV